jgi:hypothetical protein
LNRAQAWANHCYRETAHGSGDVTVTWQPTGVSQTFTTNDGCAIDYNGSCPYGERENGIEWTHPDEATCLSRAQAWANHCYREAAHGNGDVTVTWQPTGVSQTFTRTLAPTCSVSCEIQAVTIGAATHSLVVVTHDTTSGHTHHRCYATDFLNPTAGCTCLCCNDSDGTDCNVASNYGAR